MVVMYVVKYFLSELSTIKQDWKIFECSLFSAYAHHGPYVIMGPK